MATVYKKPNSPNWYYKFRHNGERYEKSTGTSSHKQALVVLKKVQAEIKSSGGYMDLYTRMVNEISKQPLDKQNTIKQKLGIK